MEFKPEDLAALPVSGSNGLREICRKVANELGHNKGWISNAKRQQLIAYLEDPSIIKPTKPTKGVPMPEPGDGRVPAPDENATPLVGTQRLLHPEGGIEVWNGADWVSRKSYEEGLSPRERDGLGQGGPQGEAPPGHVWHYGKKAWVLPEDLRTEDREKEFATYHSIKEQALISGIGKEELASKGVDACMALRDFILTSAPMPESVDEERVKALIDERVKAVQPKIHHIEVKRKEAPNIKLGVVHPAFEVCLAILQQRIPLYLQGAAGGGKTTLGKQLAEALELPYTPYTVGPSTEEHHLLGMKWPTKEGPVYDEGAFYKPYKDGGLILLDELDNGGPDVNVNLNHLLGNGECLFPNGELITAHENFCIVGGANTLGLGGDRQYIRNQQDAAFLDRWAFVKVPYDEGIEGLMAGADDAGTKPPRVTTAEGYSALDWIDRVKRIRKASTDLNERVVVSPRAMLFGRQLLEGAKLKQSIVEDVLVWNKMGDDIEKRIRSKMNEVV